MSPIDNDLYEKMKIYNSSFFCHHHIQARHKNHMCLWCTLFSFNTDTHKISFIIIIFITKHPHASVCVKVTTRRSIVGVTDILTSNIKAHSCYVTSLYAVVWCDINEHFTFIYKILRENIFNINNDKRFTLCKCTNRAQRYRFY